MHTAAGWRGQLCLYSTVCNVLMTETVNLDYNDVRMYKMLVATVELPVRHTYVFTDYHILYTVYGSQ